jgi:hypothetical protein
MVFFEHGPVEILRFAQDDKCAAMELQSPATNNRAKA